jgi:transcriptional regulator with XRE-family HTH domain
MGTPLKKDEKPDHHARDLDPVDIHVGARVRLRRNFLGLTQEQLGTALGLSFQQIQKYERGINRMGSSRLYQISKILSVPVTFFFGDLPTSIDFSTQSEGTVNERLPNTIPAKDGQNDYDILRCRETLELVRAYYRIQDVKKRRKMYELIHSLSVQAQAKD